MLLLERERKDKLVKCPTISGSVPIILLSLDLKEYNLLDEHCGSFLTNSVMFPSVRLPPSHMISKSQRFFKSTVIVAELPLLLKYRLWRDVISPSASGNGP